MACGLAIGDVDVVALTRVHFANATRLRRRRGWRPARDSGAVCLTITAKGTDELLMQRHTASKQVESQKVKRVNERLGASDRDGNFPASALQTKDRTFSTLLSLMDGGRFLRAAERFGSWVGMGRLAAEANKCVLCASNSAQVRFS